MTEQAHLKALSRPGCDDAVFPHVFLNCIFQLYYFHSLGETLLLFYSKIKPQHGEMTGHSKRRHRGSNDGPQGCKIRGVSAGFGQDC